MAFVLVGDFIPGLTRETLAIVSRWLLDGRGRADVLVVAGDGAGLNEVECWDAQFRVTYSKRSWESPSSTVGSEASCPNLAPF
jgi:hypothetical protein